MALRIDKTGFGDIEIAQDDAMFCYGIDAVLVSDFAAKKLAVKKSGIYGICDLGTGNGIIPLILAYKTDAKKIVGIEIQQRSFELAMDNARRNDMSDRLSFINCNVGDTETVCKVLGKNSFEAVTMNPPYTEKGRGMVASSAEKNIARHETNASLSDFVACADALLKDKGELFMIHRPSRLADIFAALRKYKLEPKEMQLISGKSAEVPNLVLLHCVKNAKPELKILPQIFVREEDGSMSKKIREVYEK